MGEYKVMADKDKIAVFFDAENISSKNVPSIINWLSSIGDIVFQRAYADWSMPHTKSWREQIRKTPMTAIQQFHEKEEMPNGDEKDAKDQAVDKAIMMDAIELALKHNEITKISIVASDNGYYSLALRLRELGKFIIGIGEKTKCKTLWVNSCNEFKYIEDIPDNNIAEFAEILENNAGSDVADFTISELLKEYISNSIMEDDGSVMLANLGATIRRFQSDFSYSKYGCATLRELLEKYPTEFKIFPDDYTPPNYYVKKIEQAECKSGNERFTGKISRWLGHFGFIKTNEGKEFFFTIKNLLPESSDKKPKAKSDVEFSVVKEPDPYGKTTTEKNGRATDIKILD